MVLVQGDASINSACTVTAVQADRVFLCGHPFLNLGDVQIPMARSRVLTTLSSDLASTKIVNVGGSIGTITGDHLTAVSGKLGTPPPMIPLDLSVATKIGEKKLHFEIINHPKLTPLLVAITAFNGLTQNAIYGGRHHTASHRRDFACAACTGANRKYLCAWGCLCPRRTPYRDQRANYFHASLRNTFEAPQVEHIALHVESVPGRNRSPSIAPGSKKAKPLRRNAARACPAASLSRGRPH